MYMHNPHLKFLESSRKYCTIIPGWQKEKYFLHLCFMDPKIDPVRLILEDPCRLKALQGPSKVQIDFFIDLKTTDKLKTV